jgi:hypothetical protein
MRWYSCLTLVGLVACDDPNRTFVQGVLEGYPTAQSRISLKLGTSFVDTGALGSDVLDSFVILGGSSMTTSVSGCPAELCGKGLPQMTLRGPLAPLYLGPFISPQASISFRSELFTSVGGVSFSDGMGVATLNFTDFRFFWAGENVADASGTITATSSTGTKFSGTFTLGYACNSFSPFYRFCGNQKQDVLPLNNRFGQNTCPAELLQPFEVVPTWSGTTLKFADTDVACRDTRPGGTPVFLCYQQAEVKAAGCTWQRHVLTDGYLQQFILAAKPIGPCSLPACTTFR